MGPSSALRGGVLVAIQPYFAHRIPAESSLNTKLSSGRGPIFDAMAPIEKSITERLSSFLHLRW
jgi:hypothetical protein